MNLLLRSAQIIDKSSPYHLQRKDILIQKGIITKIEKSIPAEKSYKVVESPNLCVSQGWVDMTAFLGEPGLEHKEDLYSASLAAAAGGFTTVCCLPNTLPALHSKSEIEFIKKKSESLITHILPIGALTMQCKGKELAEIYDMNNSGAIAFSDGIFSHVNAGTMMRSLLYVKPFNGIIFSFPDDASLSAGGQMNESPANSYLGMKGIPNLAESIIALRDIQLCEYTQSRLHIGYVSTPETVNALKKAKAANVAVTASVTPYNLFFTDDALHDFDTNLKVFPPIRSAKDKEALIKALKENIIDTISSFHLPSDTESKDIEYDLAEFGMIGFETAFAAANTVLKNKLSIEDILDKFTYNARNILQLQSANILQGNPADITFFDTEIQWQFEEKHIYSKSKNTPFLHQTFTGKALGVVNNNQVFIHDK